MAYFPDLSRYQYGVRRPMPGILHVGWLDHLHTFPRGQVKDEVVAKLKELAKKPVNRLFGFHLCQICRRPRLDHRSEAYLDWASERCGNGEIRFRLGDLTYAAPVLILHYIEEHGYLPPEDFLTAVLTGTPITQEEFYQSWKSKAEAETTPPAPVYEELAKEDMEALLLAKEESQSKLTGDDQRQKAEQPLPYLGKVIGMGCGVVVAPGALVFVWLQSSYEEHGYQRMARELKLWFWFGLAAWPIVLIACALLAF